MVLSRGMRMREAGYTRNLLESKVDHKRPQDGKKKSRALSHRGEEGRILPHIRTGGEIRGARVGTGIVNRLQEFPGEKKKRCIHARGEKPAMKSK